MMLRNWRRCCALSTGSAEGSARHLGKGEDENIMERKGGGAVVKHFESAHHGPYVRRTMAELKSP